MPIGCSHAASFATRRHSRPGMITTQGTQMELDDLSNRVTGCAIAVPRNLGTGRLLEAAYEHCLAYELNRDGIPSCSSCPSW